MFESRVPSSVFLILRLDWNYFPSEVSEELVSHFPTASYMKFYSEARTITREPKSSQQLRNIGAIKLLIDTTHTHTHINIVLYICQHFTCTHKCHTKTHEHVYVCMFTHTDFFFTCSTTLIGCLCKEKRK